MVDFWRMIWQEKVYTVAMVTNLKENKKIKCQQYWPESGSKSYGPFMVTITDQQVFADYTIRLLQLQVSIPGYVYVMTSACINCGLVKTYCLIHQCSSASTYQDVNNKHQCI